MKRFALAALAFCFSISVTAQTVYKCVDANGTTVFSKDPCGANAKEIDTSGANKHGEVSDAVRDISLDSDCKRRQDAVYNTYAGNLRAVQREIDDSYKSMKRSNNNLAGATRDQAISARIASLESRKTTMMDEQDHALNDASLACSADFEAENKRRQQREDALSAQRATAAKAAQAAGEIPSDDANSHK